MFGMTKGNLFPNLTVLRSYGLTVLRSYALLLSFLLSPFTTFAVDWSGTKTFTKDSVINYNITLVGVVDINVAEGKTVTINGYISGAASCHLSKNEAGTLVFSKTNSYQGQTFIQNGVLRLVSTGAIGTSYKITMYAYAKLEIYNENKVILKRLDGNPFNTIYLHTNTSGVIIGSTYTSDDGSGTFYGSIFGNGTFEKRGTGTFTFGSGRQTYKGHTYINSGKLILGEFASIDNSSGVYMGDQSKFEISGGDKTIKSLGSDPTWDEIEVILGSNTLAIGTSTTSDDGGGTFHGKITGDGGIVKRGTQTFTINARNTYKGDTKIVSGKLQLNTLGSIYNSGTVSLTGNAKLEILSGNIYEINNLTGTDNTEFIISSSTALVHLMGSKTTTFSGKFTGSGSTSDVVYKGTGHLILDGQNECAGSLQAYKGTVQLGSGGKNGKWAGNLQVGGGKLVIHGNTTIGKNFDLNSGEVIMDLTAANPSKITVAGALFAMANTKLSITTGSVTNYELIKAASGIDGVSIFTLNVPGFPTAKLTANGKQLFLTANYSDGTPPDPGTGTITCTSAATSATLKWAAATDNVTLPGKLRYFVYRSTSNNISNLADCAANGKLLNSGGTVNITTYNDKGLSSGTSYYYNVVVADEANNKAAYKAVKTTTKVGIDPITNDELRITVYPNPTTGKFNVQSSMFKVQSVEIFDVYGRKVYEDSNSCGLTVLRSYDLTVFPAGIYFLKITTETGIVTKKIIKQ